MRDEYYSCCCGGSSSLSRNPESPNDSSYKVFSSFFNVYLSASYFLRTFPLRRSSFSMHPMMLSTQSLACCTASTSLCVARAMAYLFNSPVKSSNPPRYSSVFNIARKHHPLFIQILLKDESFSILFDRVRKGPMS